MSLWFPEVRAPPPLALCVPQGSAQKGGGARWGRPKRGRFGRRPPEAARAALVIRRALECNFAERHHKRGGRRPPASTHARTLRPP